MRPRNLCSWALLLFPLSVDLADKLVAISEKGLRDAAEQARRIYMTNGHWESGREHHVL
jgi:hypothetical protein